MMDSMKMLAMGVAGFCVIFYPFILFFSITTMQNFCSIACGGAEISCVLNSVILFGYSTGGPPSMSAAMTTCGASYDVCNLICSHAFNISSNVIHDTEFTKKLPLITSNMTKINYK